MAKTMLKSDAAMMLLAEKDAHERTAVAARAVLTALVDASSEIARLHAVHGTHYSGKIGEPDMDVVDKARAAIERAGFLVIVTV